MRPTLCFAVICSLSVPVLAHGDEITDTLEAVTNAYEAGDFNLAIEELNFALAQMQGLRTESLGTYLPPAPEGWTLEVSSEMSGMLSMAGGGIGAEGTYDGDGESFTVTIIADSPMISAMGAMLSNPMIASASGGLVTRMGPVKVLEMDGSLSTIVDSRILVQAEGASSEIMMPILEQVDFDGLKAFKN